LDGRAILVGHFFLIVQAILTEVILLLSPVPSGVLGKYSWSSEADQRDKNYFTAPDRFQQVFD
jgi:hypothetical protein